MQTRPTLQYAGNLISQATSCPPTHGTLILRADDVVFAPDDGTWTLSGKAVGTNVQAFRSRPGVDQKTFATELKAILTPTQAVGTYSTPNCTYAVKLDRF